jgi:gamma-butyrobetaine dioxygenase
MSRLRITSPTELCLERDDGSRFAIHPLWLRERCLDPKSIDLRTGQRLQDASDFDPQLRISSVREVERGRLRIAFSDGHTADFLTRDILTEAAMTPGEFDAPPLELWDGTLEELPRASWRSAPGDAELADWVTRFLRYGFLILSDVPTEPETVLRVAATFGFVRQTNFGTLFDVRSKPEANDLADTSLALDPHTDNPYRAPEPGVQLLHCLVNKTSGGLSTLVDGFAVAEALRRRDPAAFRVMSQTSVRFRFRDPVTELMASTPLLDLDVTGRPRAVHFSPRLDYVPLMPPAELTEYYRARRVFDHMLRSSEFEIRFLLSPGDLMIFDNCRLLHGRTCFDPAEGLRHLQGCYIDIDAPRSLYRVLRRRSVPAPTLA